MKVKEIVKFDDIFEDDTKNAIKIKKEEYLLSGKNIVIDQNSNDSYGYSNAEDGIYTSIPTIIFGDHTRVVRYVDVPFFLGADGAKIIKSKNKDNNIKYLYYYLKSKKIENLGYSRHYKLLKECTFSIHTKCEQDKIVYILDILNEIMKLYEFQLKNFDNLVKSRFVEMFGDVENTNYKIEKLGNYIKVKGGYAFKSSEFQEEGIPVLRIGNINSGHFKKTNMVYWKEDKNLEEYIIYPKDLVISLTGTTGKEDYGNVCIMGNEYNKYYLNQRNAKIVLSEKIDAYYLSYLLKEDKIKKNLTSRGKGVRQANISNKDIETLQIPMPPIELQKKFASFVAQVDKSKFAVQKALDKTKMLMDSLMQEYFG